MTAEYPTEQHPAERPTERSRVDPSATNGGTVTGPDGLARPAWASTDPLLRAYYDTEWGIPARTEAALFERISLEAFQSGLSWATILRKREAFRAAFAGFDPEAVAAFGERETEALLGNAGIVRNRAKILATIGNARATLGLRGRGGLVDFVWRFRPERTPMPETIAQVPTRSAESEALARALRAEGFSFVGPTTMYALMEATGMVDTHLLSSHRRGTSGVWGPGGLPRVPSPPPGPPHPLPAA